MVRGNLILTCNDNATTLELWECSNGWFRYTVAQPGARGAGRPRDYTCRVYDATGESSPDAFNELPSVLAEREAKHRSCGARVDPWIDAVSQFGGWILLSTSDQYKRAYIYHSDLHRVIQVLATEPGFIVHEDPLDGYLPKGSSGSTKVFGALDAEVDVPNPDDDPIPNPDWLLRWMSPRHARR